MTDDAVATRLQRDAAALVPLLYNDLKRIARRVRISTRPGETLQTTVLVNEAYLKLARTDAWNDEAHFLRAAAQAMRQIIVDRARAQLTGKRGEGVQALSLDEETDSLDERWEMDSEDEVLALDEALGKLARLDQRLAEIVQCRYFAGYTPAQSAQALGISERTLNRDWLKAKAWLFRELKGG